MHFDEFFQHKNAPLYNNIKIYHIQNNLKFTTMNNSSLKIDKEQELLH